MAALRTLGYRAEESRQAAAFSTNQTHASLEQRVRLALSWFRPRGHSRHRSAPSGPR
jgi:Holliday junction resolvasome RuvABC DNA-binding subunit